MLNEELEIIKEAELVASFETPYRVYFDRDSGDIKSITNESIRGLDTYVELPYHEISDFVSGKKSIFDYRMVVLSGLPTFIKNIYDINSTLLAEIPDKEEKDGIIIENFPTQRVWNFSISENKKSQFEKYNLNSIIDVYIVDADNYNFLYRTIKIPISELIKNGHIVVNHTSLIEKRTNKIRILTNTSFTEINIKTKRKYDKRNKSN
jgi:hypothetical protein